MREGDYLNRELGQAYMCLCNNYGGGIENIFHWYPQNDQWWITGFNPKHVGKIDVHKQVMVGSVDFSGFEELYKKLKEEMDLEENKAKMEYLFFDDTHNAIWIIWEDI